MASKCHQGVPTLLESQVPKQNANNHPLWGAGYPKESA